MINLLKKYFFVLLILGISCDSGESRQVRPEKVYRIVYEMYSNDWYQQQAKLWRAEIDKNPTNPEAWYNYYNANRYAHFENIDTKAKKEKLEKIIDEMGKAIPETYEYYLLKYWNSWDLKDLELVEKAYALDPDRPDTYYPFISRAKIKGDYKVVQEFCEKLYESKDISPWLLNYNYNVLMSLDTNAVLITNGDNDTYPIWVLQNAKNIRKDVTVINASMSVIKEYLENNLNEKNIKLDFEKIENVASETKSERYPAYSAKFIQELVKEIDSRYPEVPVYFALTVYKPYFKPFEDELFVTGLANKYSRQGIDNFALLKKNIENDFRLDYLSYDWYTEHFPGESIRRILHTNYVVPFIMLAEHYKTSGQSEKAIRLKNMAINIARKSENKKLEEYINKKDL